MSIKFAVSALNINALTLSVALDSIERNRSAEDIAKAVAIARNVVDSLREVAGILKDEVTT